MTESVTVLDAVPAHTTGADVEFFDPPMCCPTGLCGPALDQTLLDVSEMILALRADLGQPLYGSAADTAEPALEEQLVC